MKKIDQLKEKISKLDSEKGKSVEELERLLKLAKERKEKKIEKLYNELFNELMDTATLHDVDSIIYYDYFDDWDDSGPKLIRDLTENRTSETIVYNYDELIESEIQIAQSHVKAYSLYVEALKRFKEYVKKKVEEEKKSG